MESLGKEAAEGRREGSLEVRLKSRDDAAFDTLERAKHWTAFHVARTIRHVCNLSSARLSVSLNAQAQPTCHDKWASLTLVIRALQI